MTIFHRPSQQKQTPRSKTHQQQSEAISALRCRVKALEAEMTMKEVTINNTIDQAIEEAF